jgi:hypothetical protein
MVNYLVKNTTTPPLLKLTYTEVYTPATNPLCIDYIPELENGVYVKKVVNGEVVDRPQIEIDAYERIYAVHQINKNQWNELYFNTFTFDGVQFLLDKKSIWYYESLRGKAVDTDVQAVDGIYTVLHTDKEAFIVAYENKMKEILKLVSLTS